MWRVILIVIAALLVLLVAQVKGAVPAVLSQSEESEQN